MEDDPIRKPAMKLAAAILLTAAAFGVAGGFVGRAYERYALDRDHKLVSNPKEAVDLYWLGYAAGLRARNP